MTRFFTTSIYTAASLAFLLFILPSSVSAQSAEFQWALNVNGGIQVNAEEDGSDFLYDLQLHSQNDEIVNKQTNSSGDFLIQNSDLTAGEVYDLSLKLIDESSDDNPVTHTEQVAVPKITVDSSCNPDLAGGTVDFTVDMIPEIGFPNLSEPEVTPFESGSKRNAVPGLPYTHKLAQPGWTYRFEISFSDSNIVLNSGDVTESCEEEEVNFSYAVNGRDVTAEVLSPLNDNYSYAWDVSNGEEAVDYLGMTLEYTFPADSEEASVRLVVSQDDTLIGDTTRNFIVPTNIQDLDGDGKIDDNEDEETGESDRDGDGVPNAEDECPDDPTNTCNESEDDIEAPEGGLVNCTNNCGWDEFIDLIDKLITWLVGFATVVATLLFMYAGFLYLTAGGNESQTDQAKGILTNTAVGFAILLLAWLIVSTVVTLLTTEKWRDDSEELLPIEFSYEIDKDTLQL